jgi:transposase
MAPREKTKWKVERRKRAWALYQAGWEQNDIAEAMGVSTAAVSQWIKRGRAGGSQALETKHTGGRPAGLSEADLKRLVRLLAKGAESFGFRGAVWNNPRVAQLIQREFGIRYHPAHVSRLLKHLGWTPQKPIVRAKQRDPKEVERWWRERWPKLKKRSTRKAGRSYS